MIRNIIYLGLIGFSTLMIGCDKSGDTETDLTDNNTTELPDLFDQFDSGLNIYVEGNFVIIQSNNVPDHSSPYFDSGDSRYESYNGSNTAFNLNPNRIGEQNFVYKIPINPSEATNKSTTPLGPMGVAINGVAIYNQYAGPNNQALTNEINSFDQYNGHPDGGSRYHYHVEPTFLTQAGYQGRDGLLGVLLDGFPVYGPIEAGSTVTNSDLDAYHGHFGTTADFPAGIYHYHITDADPYINGSGFFGTAGTITN